MHHAAPQYGQQSSAMSANQVLHYQANASAAPTTHSAASGAGGAAHLVATAQHHDAASTAALRQWRKKDDKFQMDATGSDEPQGQIARVAPHNHNPLPRASATAADAYHPPNMYVNHQYPYGMVHEQKVKYSEIVEPHQQPPQHLGTPVIQKQIHSAHAPPAAAAAAKEMMCSVVEQTGQAQVPQMSHHVHAAGGAHIKNYPAGGSMSNMLAYKDFGGSIHAHSKEPPHLNHLNPHHAQHGAHGQYIQKEYYGQNYKLAQYQRPLAGTNQYQEYFGIPGGNAEVNAMYPPYNRAHSNFSNYRNYRATNSNATVTGFGANVQNYFAPGGGASGNAGAAKPQDMYRGNYAGYRLPAQVSVPTFDLRNISPRRIYPEVHYAPPRGSPNYYGTPTAQQLEYAQHYQNRQGSVYQLPQINNLDTREVVGKAPYHHLIPNMDPHAAGHMAGVALEASELGAKSSSSSLKQFIEGYNPESGEELKKSEQSQQHSQPSQQAVLSQGQSQGQAHSQSAPIAVPQQSLYILDSTEIPSENIGEYIHLQVDKLPENIKGFLGSGSSVITSPLNLTQDSVIKEPSTSATPNAIDTPPAPAPVLGISVISEAPKKAGSSVSSPSESAASSVIVYGDHNKSESVDENKNLTEASAATSADKVDTSVIKTAGAQREFADFRSLIKGSEESPPERVEEFKSPRTPGSNLEEIPKPLNDIEQFLDDSVDDNVVDLFVKPQGPVDSCENLGKNVEVIQQTAAGKSLAENTEKDVLDRKTSVIENIEVKKMEPVVDAIKKSEAGFEDCEGTSFGERVINVNDDHVTLKIGGEIIKISLKDNAVCICAVTDCAVIVDGQSSKDSGSVCESKSECASEASPHVETNLSETIAETVAEKADHSEEIVSSLEKKVKDTETLQKGEEMKTMPKCDMPELQNQSINATLEEDKVETNEASEMPQLDAELYSPHSLGDIEAILNDNCNEVIIDGGGDAEVELSLSGLNSPVVSVPEIPDDEKYVIADSSDSKDECEPEHKGEEEDHMQKEEDVEMKVVDTEKVSENTPLREALVDKCIEEMSCLSSSKEVPVIIPDKPNLDINLDGLIVDAIPKLKKAFVHLKETDREEVRKHIEGRMLEEVVGKAVKKRKRLQTMKQFKTHQLARVHATIENSREKVVKKVDGPEISEKSERSEKERLMKRRRSSSEVDERKIEPWGVRSKSEMVKRKRTNSESNREIEDEGKKTPGALRRKSHDVEDKRRDSQNGMDKTRRVSRDFNDVKNERDLWSKGVKVQKEETTQCQALLKVDKRKERLSLLDDSTCSSATSSSSIEEKSKDKVSTKLTQERCLERTKSVDGKDNKEKIAHRRLSEKQPREESEIKHSKIESDVPNEAKDLQESREMSDVKDISDFKEEKVEKYERLENLDRTDRSEKIEKLEKSDKTFISEKRNFSILAKDEKTKTKIKTPSARNKRLESLVESSVRFQKTEKVKVEHSEKEKEKNKEDNCEPKLCNAVSCAEESKPIVVKTKAQLKETSDKVTPADVSVQIPKSCHKSASTDCKQSADTTKVPEKVEKQLKPGAGAQKASFLKSVNKLRTGLAKSSLSSSVKRLSLAEYKKKRSDSLPFPEDERKPDDLLMSKSAGISADMDTLLERALDAPSLSKLNIPAIIENIPLDAIRAEDVLPSTPTPPVVITLQSDANERPTDPRLKHLNQKNQAQSHQVVQPGTPSPGGVSVYAGHSHKAYPNLEVRRRSYPTLEDPRLKRTNLDTVYADINLSEKYLSEKERVTKKNANVFENNLKGCCNDSLVDAKKGSVEPAKRPQSPKVPEDTEKLLSDQTVLEKSVAEIEKPMKKSVEEGSHALPELPNFDYIQTLQQLKKLRGTSMSTSSESTSDSSSTSDSDSDSSDSDSDASNSSRLKRFALAKLKISTQRKDPAVQTCSKLDLNKEIDDIFVLTQKKFDLRPRKTGTSSECDSEPQTHNPCREKQKERYLINLDEIKTSLDFSDGPQRFASLTATTSVKRKKLFIDPDDFNLDDEYVRTSSDSDREVHKSFQERVVERARSTGLKNIIDLNELLPGGMGGRQRYANRLNVADMGRGSSERFQKYEPDEIFRESNEVFSTKVYEKFDNRIDERDIDEFINKEPPCVVKTVAKCVRDEITEKDEGVGLMDMCTHDDRDRIKKDDGELQKNVNVSYIDDCNVSLPESSEDKDNSVKFDNNIDEAVKDIKEDGSDTTSASSTLRDVLVVEKEEIDYETNNEIKNKDVKAKEESFNDNVEAMVTESESLADENTIEEKAEENDDDEEMKTVEAKILLESAEERLDIAEEDVAKRDTVENFSEKVVEVNNLPEIERSEDVTVDEERERERESEEVPKNEGEVLQKEIEEKMIVVPQNINEDEKEIGLDQDDKGANDVLLKKYAEDTIEEVAIPRKERECKMDDAQLDPVSIPEEFSNDTEKSSNFDHIIPDLVPLEEVKQSLEKTNTDIETSSKSIQVKLIEELSAEGTSLISDAEEMHITIEETESINEGPKKNEELVSELSQRSTPLESDNMTLTNIEETKNIPDCGEKTESTQDEVVTFQGMDQIEEKLEEVTTEPPLEVNVEVVGYDSDDDENVPMNLSINHHHKNDARPRNLCAVRTRDEAATAAMQEASEVSDTSSSNVIVNNSFISNVISADANSVCAEDMRAEKKLPKGAAANQDQTCDHSAELICRDDVPRNSKSKPRNLCDIANGAGGSGKRGRGGVQEAKATDEGDDISCTIEETKVIFRNLRKGTKGMKGKARSPPKSPPKDVGGEASLGSMCAQRQEEKKKSIEDISKRLLGTQETISSESESYRTSDAGDGRGDLALSNWRNITGLSGRNPLAYGDYAGSAPSMGGFPTFPNFQMPPLNNEMWAKWQQMQQYYQMVYFHQTHLQMHQQQAQHGQSHGQASGPAQSLDKQYGVSSSADLKMKLHRIQPQDQPQNLSQSHPATGPALGDDDDPERKRRKRRRLQKQNSTCVSTSPPVGDSEIVSVDDADDYLVVKTGAPAEQTGIPKLIIKRSITNSQSLADGHAQNNNNNNLCTIDQNQFRAPGDDKYGLEPVVRIERNPQLDILAYNGRKRRKS